MHVVAPRVMALAVRQLVGLRRLVPGVLLNGPSEPRLPNTLNLSFPGVSGEALLIALDRMGIEVSAGSACGSGSTLPSPVLAASGLGSERISSSLRSSLGRGTTEAEITHVLEVLPPLVARLRPLPFSPRSPQRWRKILGCG